MPISVTYFVYGSSITPLKFKSRCLSINLVIIDSSCNRRTTNNNVYEEIEFKQDTVSRDSFRKT